MSTGLNQSDNPQDTLIKLLKLSRSLMSTRELDKLLGLIVRAFLQATEADRVFLLLAEPPTLKAVRGEHKDGRALETAEARISSLAQQVADDGKPIYSTNLDLDQALGRRDSISELGLHMVVCVPLKGPSGVVGVIYCDGKSTLDTVFTTANRSALEALADHAGAAIENARLFEGAIRDPLTGLFNLGFFQVRVTELCESPHGFSGGAAFVALVELDDAVEIAARLGPQTADEVLKAVADTLRAHVVLPELAARLGPKTFGLCFAERDERLALDRMEKLVAHNGTVTVDSMPESVSVRLKVGVAPLAARYDATMAAAQRAAENAERAASGVAIA